MDSQEVAISLGVSRRWILAILGRGLLVGIAHPTLAMFLGMMLGERDTDFWGGFVVFGIAIAAVLCAAFAILTLPVALRAARVGRWGRLRLVVTFIPAAALVAIGVVLVPLEPAGEPVSAADVLVQLAWFWLGPACWGAAIMWRVTGRLPR